MNNLIFNVSVISSRMNSTVVKIAKLQNKKYRMEEKLFVCEGIKLFCEAFNFGVNIEYIVLNNDTVFDNDIVVKLKKAVEYGTKLLCVEGYVFDKLTTENSPQGIIIVGKFFDKKHIFSAFVKNDDLKDEKVVVLESVRDPGNLGTILRNAVAFGIEKLILTSDCADIYSPKVIRSSMGALFKIDICIVEDLKTSVENIKLIGRRVLATAINNNSLVLGKNKISNKDVVILGNEGHGMSDEIINMCTDTLFIPIKDNTESLNVATASAILMWEISK